jgi:uncharacterized protein (DUF2062 family)
MVTGLFFIAVACAFVGYGVSIVVWRWWIGTKWRRRMRRELFQHTH